MVVAAAVHLAVVVRMAIDGSPLAYHPLNRAFIHAALFGFITNFIFAVSLRAVRGFLGLKPLRARTEFLSFVAVNTGTAILVTFSAFEQFQTLAMTGAIVLSLGLVIYSFSIRVLEPGTQRTVGIPGAYGRFAWFIRTSYAWLLVAAVLMSVQAAADMSGHLWLRNGLAAPVLLLVTLGFVTGLIMGVGARMVPIFEGSEVLHPWLLDAALVLQPASMAIRLASSFSDATQAALGVSGVMSLLAILFSGVAALEAMSERARKTYRERAAALGQARILTSQQAPPALAKVEFMKRSGSRPAPPGSR